MIYIRDLDRTDICGYLGNNLFQLAAGIALAEENETTLMVPSTWKYADWVPETGVLKYGNKSEFKITEEYTEPHFHYSKIPYVNGMNLNGYYQSEKYFENVKKKIRFQYFNKLSTQFADGCEPFVKNIFPDRKEQRIIAIHVRRGDYNKFPNHFYKLDMSYYGNAIRFFKDKYPKCKFLVFSNDINECKNMFTGDEFIFSETDQNKTEGNDSTMIDFTLMVSCDGFIIANSSFSWWAAYLCNYSSSIVMSPSKWFGSALNNDTKDLFVSGWLGIKLE